MISSERLPLPDDLAAAVERVRPRLGRLGSRVLYFPVTASTNDVAVALANEGDCEGVVVVADEQTAGRGRRGRQWFSPPASGLYVSVVLAPATARADATRAARLLTLASGVALAEGVGAAAGLKVELKWPNDVYVGGRKLGGILAETAGGQVVLGFGVNVGPMVYPPDLADRATSLDAELGRPVERAPLLAETLAALWGRYDDLLDGRFDAILDAWRARAPGAVGRPVTWVEPSGSRSGLTAGIDAEGALLVKVGDRIERIVAGEMTWS
jgi:BirA family biotin operon repressor/biotin-[acetyl-CoA-carboxylase] ligase